MCYIATSWFFEQSQCEIIGAVCQIIEPQNWWPFAKSRRDAALRSCSLPSPQFFKICSWDISKKKYPNVMRYSAPLFDTNYLHIAKLNGRIPELNGHLRRSAMTASFSWIRFSCWSIMACISLIWSSFTMSTAFLSWYFHYTGKQWCWQTGLKTVSSFWRKQILLKSHENQSFFLDYQLLIHSLGSISFELHE